MSRNRIYCDNKTVDQMLRYIEGQITSRQLDSHITWRCGYGHDFILESNTGPYPRFRILADVHNGYPASYISYFKFKICNEKLHATVEYDLNSEYMDLAKVQTTMLGILDQAGELLSTDSLRRFCDILHTIPSGETRFDPYQHFSGLFMHTFLESTWYVFYLSEDLTSPQISVNLSKPRMTAAYDLTFKYWGNFVNVTIRATRDDDGISDEAASFKIYTPENRSVVRYVEDILLAKSAIKDLKPGSYYLHKEKVLDYEYYQVSVDRTWYDDAVPKKKMAPLFAIVIPTMQAVELREKFGQYAKLPEMPEGMTFEPKHKPVKKVPPPADLWTKIKLWICKHKTLRS